MWCPHFEVLGFLDLGCQIGVDRVIRSLEGSFEKESRSCWKRGSALTVFGVYGSQFEGFAPLQTLHQ